MARYQLILAYDGTNFLGFQRQGSVRTVQSELEAALRRLGWSGKSILSAGRTDTGVHASGQVIAFDLDWRHPTAALGSALNALLPQDVAVCEVGAAAEQFHPRFDALERCYHYRLFASPHRNPLLERHAWRIWPDVDAALLQKTANLLVGTHDFAAFGSPMKAGGSTFRCVTRAQWKMTEAGWLFEVAANAFLYHMVRRMVHAQVMVGQNRLSVERFCQALECGAGLPAGLAKPNGLELVTVTYRTRIKEQLSQEDLDEMGRGGQETAG